MKRILTAIAALVLLTSAAYATIPVVPYPTSVQEMKGRAFNVKSATIYAADLDELSMKWVIDFAEKLRSATGKAIPIKTTEFKRKQRMTASSGFDPFTGKWATVDSWEDAPAKAIIFSYNLAIADEAYTLSVNYKDGVRIEAGSPAGFFYAIQTLKQLLPVEVFTGVRASKKTKWTIAPMKIQDRPRFAYRGMHLDCARHFFSIDEVKKYIDVMAMFKMNRFHWHLTEDQGWRIEIKKYPRLTEVGAWRDGTCIGKDFDSSDGIRYGGYYTQEQMKEVVAYAAERGITVIPELDLPGHMLAALASYPELGCTGGPYAVWQRWGITNDILCAGNEKVYEFLEDVLSEICDIFPSEYIHIGGDECFLSELDDPWDKCPKCIAKMEELGIERGPQEKHYLQNYVTARMQSFLQSMGRKIIGWDEILEGELAPGATVMSWRGTSGGIKAAAKGFDAIMTPYDYLYFDYYQTRERDKEPLAIGGFLPLETVYGYDPLDGITAGAEKHILGVQANLWTEYITSDAYLEYMLLPRMCALSELQWTPKENKSWDRFNASLDHLFSIFDALDYTYCRAVRGEIGLK